MIDLRYDGGVYYCAAKGGFLIWEMATTEPGLKNRHLSCKERAGLTKS